MDYQSIPQEALSQLSCCTTADEIMELADQYNIPLSYEEAEALLMGDVATLSALNGCGNSGKVLHNCSTCEYGSYYPLTNHIAAVHYICSYDGPGNLITITNGRNDPESQCPM